ncbi:MAG: redoxin domain-containing protein [Bacillota bacterium]
MEKKARFCHQCGWDSRLAAAGKGASTAGQRPTWKRWVTGVSLGVASLLVLLLMLIPRTGADTMLRVGEPAPDFELTTLEGETVKLSALRGKPVVVNFWATWCTPCRKEMPHFQEVVDKYGEQGLLLYGINVGESKVAVADFRDRVGVRFPLMIDADESVQTAYKILPLPATFFIDREGVIRGVYQFQMSLPQIEDEVKRLIAR